MTKYNDGMTTFNMKELGAIMESMKEVLGENRKVHSVYFKDKDPKSQYGDGNWRHHSVSNDKETAQAKMKHLLDRGSRRVVRLLHDFPYHPSPADPSVTRYVDGMLQNGVRNKFGDHESWDERGNKNTFSIQR